MPADSNARVAIFSRRVRDVMRKNPVVLSAHEPVRNAVARFAETGTGAVLVVDEDGRLGGILTERDVVQRVAFQVDGSVPLDRIMTAPVDTIEVGDYVYHAIARMRRFNRHHFPVVDADHRPVGMVRLDRALASAVGPLMGQIDRLTRDDTREGLGDVKAAQFDLAQELLDDALPAPEIQAVITHINNDIYRRVVERQIKTMETDGRGAPPVGFAVIVMGSGGRGESFVSPDQDNGFILADYPDRDHEAIDGWFVELAGRITQELDLVGFPLCKGGVMATNPLWRKTLSQWRAQTDLWMQRRSSVAIRLGDIFFDFVSVCGDTQLAGRLRKHVTEQVQRHPALLRDICEHDAEHRTALGLFGRLRTEKDDPEHQGKVNLKYNGTLPLVSAVRLLALRHGIRSTRTLARIEELVGREVVDADRADALAGAYRVITGIMLRQQIEDFRAGARPSNYVPLDRITSRERSVLKQSLRAIEELRQKVRSDFTGDLF